MYFSGKIILVEDGKINFGENSNMIDDLYMMYISIYDFSI